MSNKHKTYSHNFLISLLAISTLAIVLSNYIFLKKATLDFENIITQKEYAKIWWEENYKLLMEIQKQNMLKELEEFRKNNPEFVSNLEKKINWETYSTWANILTKEEFEIIKQDTYVKWSTWSLLTIVEFWDFDCEHCFEFHNSWLLTNVLNENQWKIDYIFKNSPLQSHEEAREKSIIWKCIYDKLWWEKYFDYIDWVYVWTMISSDTPFDYKNLALDLWLDKDNYDDCLVNPKYSEQIDKEIWQWIYLWVRIVPSLVVINNETLEYSLVQSDEIEDNINDIVDNMLR